jgi:ubiquitin-conjugating enzyme E2 G1
MALKRLHSEYIQITKDPNYFYSILPNPDNFLIWDILIIGPPDTLWAGGIFNTKIEFPKNYPNSPPTFYFVSELFHPNIYSDGKVCISILHEGIDEYGYESVNERWNPSHSVNSILMSILSMFSDPNLESPANLDASKMWKENLSEYKKKIYNLVTKTN